jgi:hypothetical protein
LKSVALLWQNRKICNVTAQQWIDSMPFNLSTFVTSNELKISSIQSLLEFSTYFPRQFCLIQFIPTAAEDEAMFFTFVRKLQDSQTVAMLEFPNSSSWATLYLVAAREFLREQLFVKDTDCLIGVLTVRKQPSSK